MKGPNWFPDTAFTVAEWPDRAPDRHPDTLRWIELIEAERRLTPAPTTRRCSACDEVKPLDAFARSSTRGSGGRAYVCKRCKAGEFRQRYRQRKVARFRAALGRAS